MSHIRTIVKIVTVFLMVLSPVWGQLAMARDLVLTPSATSADINAALAQAKDGDRVTLSAGEFRLAAPLQITRNHVALVGAGSGRTTLRFLDETRDFISVQGRMVSKRHSLEASAKSKATRIELLANHGFAEGDMIYLQQANTPEWIAQNGWSNVSWKEAAKRPFRESLHRIVEVNGTRVSLASPLPFGLNADVATVQRVIPRKGVSVSGLTITGDLGKADSNDFTNTQPNASKRAALRVHYGLGFSGTDLAFENTPSTAVVLHSTIESNLDSVGIDGAHNKGGLGNGYGLELREAFNNRAGNLTIRNMRHAVIFSAWHAEAGNHIHVRHTNRDINFHGSIDHSNTVTIDEIALEFAPDRSRSKRRNVWPTISPGGTNHAKTDFLSVNTVAMKAAKGSWRDDVFVGSLVGGAFEGGFGKDTFVANGPIRIMDYEAGDRVRLVGEETDFVLRSDHQDTVLSIAGKERVRFLNTSPDQINRASIAFTAPSAT